MSNDTGIKYNTVSRSRGFSKKFAKYLFKSCKMCYNGLNDFFERI